MNNQDERSLELWSDPVGAKAFFESQARWIAEQQTLRQRDFLIPENRLCYSHGGDIVNPGHEDPSPTDMETHFSSWDIGFDEIRQNDLGAWVAGLEGVIEAIHANFMGLMVRTLSESTEKSGNVVDAKSAGSFPEAFLQMMEKIQLSVSRTGEVLMPSVLVHPDTAEKQIAELEAQPPEYLAKFESVKRRKIEEARARERERLSRFKGYVP
jgi:hypothetical protein